MSILTPFPKTPLFEELQRNGRLLTTDWSYYNGKTAVAFRPNRMSPRALWDGYMWFRRHFFSPACILQRVRRSGVRPLQSIALNLGYWCAIGNQIPGHPIIQLCLGTVYAWSYFQKPLVEMYGWSNAQVAGTFSLAICCLGLAAAWGGLQLPRLGPRRLAVAGGVFFGVGHLVAALALRCE